MEEADKNYALNGKLKSVGALVCDPLVVIASDIQVRIAGKVFLTGYCKTTAYNSFLSVAT